ncbi:unnamed protein product [Notodromas monacha]|uniref:SSD domain-containing protein n=1 Tax=Notodromas monacha TaxID=399045 RepID=A0A7R9BDG9_9CRUS|nr:unnamed protein product [Notodromas monacha]CAG0912623.1 unnamed protein product [Notodromas monacha]
MLELTMPTKCRYSRTILERWLRKTAGKLGFTIGKSPWWCATISLAVFCGFGLGMFSMQSQQSLDDMRFVIGGPMSETVSVIDSLFPTNYSHFTPDRSVHVQRSGVVLLRPKSGTNILTPAALREVRLVNEAIVNAKVEHPGTKRGSTPDTFTFRDVCPKWQSECFAASCAHVSEFNIDQGKLKYPITFGEDRKVYFFAGCLGNPVFRLNSTNVVLSSPAIRLPYFLDDHDLISSIKAQAWEQRFWKIAEDLRARLNHTEMYFYSATSRDKEIQEVTTELGPTIIVSSVLLLLFTVLCGLTTDCAVTKPWIGLLALVSTGLGILSGMGLGSSLGIPFSPTCVPVPFLCLGLGLDGAFVLLGAWRATDDEKSVPKRMARTYESAGVALCITTVTDVLTFAIGITIPHGTVRLFCIWMAHTNSCARICCIGCGESTKTDSAQYVGISERIFRRIYAPLLNRKSFKGLVVFLYILYAFVACIGISKLEMNIDELRGLQQTSPTILFRQFNLQDFQYNIRVQFIDADPVFGQDVAWKNGDIVASRIFLQMVNVTSVQILSKTIEHLNQVFEEFPELDIHAYHPEFRMHELSVMLPEATREGVFMAIGAMTLVAFLLIPNMSGIFVVTCSILSVQMGVVGYMTLWGVHYDLYSMVMLIMTIGFSVDFCAHTAYAFYSQKPTTDPVERLGIGLTHVGLPILQGTTSTVIAVVGLLLTGIHVHVMFFKVVFLIMTIGALHAILFLPVCMLIFETVPWKAVCCADSSVEAPAADADDLCEPPDARHAFLQRIPPPPYPDLGSASKKLDEESCSASPS